MTADEEQWMAWFGRLHVLRGEVVTLTRETTARPLSPNLDLLWGEPNLVLAAGTHVRYETTQYDAMRLDDAHHVVKVESGPNAGRFAAIRDLVGPWPLPWEV